jgi:serine/threonine protein kinase
MTTQGQPRPSEPLRDAIQTRHPGIADEIEGAINTLRKLKEIAKPGASVDAPPDQHQAELVTLALTGAFQAPPASSQLEESSLIAATQAEPVTEQAVPVLAASTSFGRYQIVRLLGRGAMGAVYLAYDTQLHRHVALKTPRLGTSSQMIDRFYREARAAAQLRSPYLCPIFDVGQIGGIHYLSMAFIDGKSLTRVMVEGRYKTQGAIADLLKSIARGLQKAHEQGIIHRDLKPDNIMIDHDGAPIVMDFGLARRIDDVSQVTLPGVLVGTPAFMSPEQVDGDAKMIGPPTDIYSLGIILYQLLTGRLPFQGSVTSILRQIGSQTPSRPSAINQELGEDSLLERVCLKMIAKSPADRYASMADVVAALDESSDRCADVPIAARSPLNWLRSLSSGVFSCLLRSPRTHEPSQDGSPAVASLDEDRSTLADS